MIAIETERLTLRSFVPGDWRALHGMIVRYQASPMAVYDQPWPTAEEEIRGVTEWFAGGDSFLAVCLKETGRFIGFVALNPEEDDRSFNLGYVFDTPYHGQGYATEACRAALGRAFEDLQAERVVTGTAAANTPSVRLLARLGFTKTGEHSGAFATREDGTPLAFMGYTFALTREAWEAARGTASAP